MALEADEAPTACSWTKGALRGCFLEWQTSHHPSSFLFNQFQVFTRLPSFCSINKASKTHHPLVAHLFVVCAARPPCRQRHGRHRWLSVIAQLPSCVPTGGKCHSWSSWRLSFQASPQWTGLNQLSQRLAEEIRSATPLCISLECGVFFIFCYLYGPSVTLLL